MRQSHSTIGRKRFIGDNKTKVFHDTYFEAYADVTDSCRTADLPPEAIETFYPDTPRAFPPVLSVFG